MNNPTILGQLSPELIIKSVVKEFNMLSKLVSKEIH